MNWNWNNVGNKGEIIPENIPWKLHNLILLKRGGRDEAWTNSLS